MSPLVDTSQSSVSVSSVDYNLMDLRQEVEKFHLDYPDAIILIQVGGFYEIFDYNGQLDRMASTLGLAIGTRKSKRNPPVRFTGFPTHQLSRYLKRIVEDGNTVVLVDRMGYEIERRLMRRSVTRVVSPGTLINDDDGIINRTNNFVLLIAQTTERDQKRSSSNTTVYGLC